MDITKFYNLDYDVNYKLQESEYSEEISNEKYRNDILNVFKINSFYGNENIIDEAQVRIYQHLNKNKKLNGLFIYLSNQFFCEDALYGFIITFSYHFFQIIHKIIVSYYKHNHFDDNLINELELEIKKIYDLK